MSSPTHRKAPRTPSASTGYGVPWWLRGLMGFNRVFMRSWHRVQVLGRPEVPAVGPVLLAANHTAGLDPLTLQSVLSRPVRWMMAAEYLEVRPLRPVFNAVRIIPVNRDGRDSTATRIALRGLAEGDVLGIFPEGKIETSRDFLPFHPGVAHLAQRTGAPIIPVYLDGTQRGQTLAGSIVWRQKVTAAFGPPLRGENPGELMEELARALHELKAMTEGWKEKIASGVDKPGNA